MKKYEHPTDKTTVTAPATPSPAPPSPARERALRVLAELPPFSPILNRLIASLAKEDVSFAKISELIEKDTVLAGNILKLVNSALYGFSGTINSVRHAVSLLGVNKLRNATLSMSVARMWKQVKTPPGWSMGSFNLHSAGVAILADLLAQKVDANYPEGAFAAGLFHDLGWLLVAMGCPDEFKQISLLCRPDQKWAAEYELEVLGVSHADLSAEALAAWNLPEPIRDAVRYHQTPAEDPAASDPDLVPLSRILNVADAFVQGMGTNVSVFENSGNGAQNLPDELRLGDQLSAVLAEFDNEFEAIKPYF
ncbi:MAG TPA: HDOD domain-containing protein [Bryobacteraceae bacterium]|nr:HDOD domain-containing protein [Bryobacteraceae bacterium]